MHRNNDEDTCIATVRHMQHFLNKNHKSNDRIKSLMQNIIKEIWKKSQKSSKSLKFLNMHHNSIKTIADPVMQRKRILARVAMSTLPIG